MKRLYLLEVIVAICLTLAVPAILSAWNKPAGKQAYYEPFRTVDVSPSYDTTMYQPWEEKLDSVYVDDWGIITYTQKNQ